VKGKRDNIIVDENGHPDEEDHFFLHLLIHTLKREKKGESVSFTKRHPKQMHYRPVVLNHRDSEIFLPELELFF
jgi:hypothetical protein